MKPRISVTEILNKIYGKPEVPEEILIHGTNAHRVVQEEYKKMCKDIEVEKEIELDRGKYILHGKIDIVDHCNHVIVEIKTKNSVKTRRARDQLSAYVAMWRKLHNDNYYGMWLIYSWKEPSRFYLVKPFFLDLTILDEFDKIAEEIINGYRAKQNSGMDNITA